MPIARRLRFDKTGGNCNEWHCSSGSLAKHLYYAHNRCGYNQHRVMTSDPRNRPISPLAGAIASYIHPGGKIGVLVELGCESDFVARTESSAN